MIKMKQKVKTPELVKCLCGHTPQVRRSYDPRSYDRSYEVHCKDCGKTGPQYCKNKHRAICKWNNRIERHVAEDNLALDAIEELKYLK